MSYIVIWRWETSPKCRHLESCLQEYKTIEEAEARKAELYRWNEGDERWIATKRKVEILEVKI